jgi:mRNA degradation ribonuclease J1/J2
VVHFSSRSATVVERVPIGRVLVEGRQYELDQGTAVQSRRQMATGGAVFAVVIRRGRTRDLAVHLTSRGLVADARLAACLGRATREATDALRQLPGAARTDKASVEQAIDAAVTAVFEAELSRSPVVTTMVIES